MTLTTPNNGNTRPSPPVEDALAMIIAFVICSPVLGCMIWIFITLIKLMAVLDQPY